MAVLSTIRFSSSNKSSALTNRSEVQLIATFSTRVSFNMKELLILGLAKAKLSRATKSDATCVCKQNKDDGVAANQRSCNLFY